MASRSFKPASYLAQPAKRSPRPSFNRSSSASSTKSEDSFIATLRNSSAENARDSTSSLAPAPTGRSPQLTPVNNSSLSRPAIEDTPGRKRSQPIAIEPRSRTAPVYTPLTARGELKGGYFPYHDPSSKSYIPSSFPKNEQENHESRRTISGLSSPPIMSNASSTSPSPTDSSRRGPHSLLDPAFISSPVSEVLAMPRGKYHPSNYKLPSKGLPTSAPSLPPTNLTLPSIIPGRKKRAVHERQASDVKRKLQEYQMGQARNAAILADLHGHAARGVLKSEPSSPRLVPLGSPGPITPFTLEENEHAGYVVAGARRSIKKEGLKGRSLDDGREQELVGEMIRAEEERRLASNQGVCHSSAMRV